MSPLNQGKTKLKIYMASTSIRTRRKRLTHLYQQDQLERSRRPCDYNLQASQDARTHAIYHMSTLQKTTKEDYKREEPVNEQESA